MTPQELRDTRREFGLTQSQMAAALNTSLRTYQGWESNRGSVPGIVAAALACYRNAVRWKKR